MPEHKWMSTGYLRAAPAGEINADKGVIAGVSVCTVGEAKGHGVNLDSEFVGRVAELGNSKKQGLKARFGHPNMCSTALGTFLGRFKNFRVDGEQVRADLFVSNEAKETPHGNLYDYVMGMAAHEPDMFGTSIVFTPGRFYKRDAKGNKIVYPGWGPDEDETPSEHSERVREYRDAPGPEYVECEELHACDAVDDPAANEGLFSRFAQETIAGQITEFLDLHPQVWAAISDNPSIIEALAKYGERVDEFITRYRAYREHKPGETAMSDKPNSEKLEKPAESVQQPAAPAPAVKPEKPADKPAAAEAAASKPAVPPAPPSAESAAAASAEVKKDDKPQMSREEFVRIADEFGNDIAVQTVKDGGDYHAALAAYAKQQKDENAKLRARVAELESAGAGTPAKVTAVPAKEKASLFNSEKKPKK